MSGWEDEEIQDYFINTAFPSEQDTDLVLNKLGQSGGMTLREIQGVVNLRQSRITSMLKILEVEGAVYRQGSRWFRSAERWTYPRERIEAVTASRRTEQQAMKEYVSTDECLMQFLRRELDDPGAEPCGRCANCVGPRFTTDVDRGLTERALDMLRSSHLEIKPRSQRPCDLGDEVNLKVHQMEAGRCLTRWGDPGLAELVRSGKYHDHRFDDALVDATVGMIRRWGPTPAPTWITWIPSTRGVVDDFTLRLAKELALDAVESIHRVREGKPQKAMENSCQQARNVVGAFEVIEVREGPVLLIDDMVDSRWTFTIAGAQLRAAGSGLVYPVALANTSRGGE
jgi:ATP-dependent DNA helicase RecQ